MVTHIKHGDARALPWEDGTFHACVTSPPYFGLRRYDAGPAEIGAEPTPDAYVASLVDVGREVRRVLRDDGTWWLNIGDSYARSRAGPPGSTGSAGPKSKRARERGACRDGDGVASKNLLLIPARVALALQADGWVVRAECPWIKANAMPGSQMDRPTLGHETIYLLVKSPRYFFDLDAVRREQTRGAAGSTFTDGKTGVNGMGRCSTRPREDNHAGRSLRTSDFFYDSLDVIRADLARVDAAAGPLTSTDGEPLAFDVPTTPSGIGHFAMWPPRLVAHMVRASTSERGCCPKCGAPWLRRVERTKMVYRASAGQAALRAACPADSAGSRTNIRGTMLSAPSSSTVGWSPSCSCPAAEPVPCRVLDPFGGSGTTIAVADALGRDGYHVELNPEYLSLPDARRSEVRAAMLGEAREGGKRRVGDTTASIFDLFKAG